MPAGDFKLSGWLEIKGIDGLDREINNMRAKLSNAGLAGVSRDLEKVNRSASVARSGIKGLHGEIRIAETSIQNFAQQSALALRRFAAFSIAAGAAFGTTRAILGGLKQAALFERELVKVQQVSNASAQSINSLRKEIARLGVTLAAPAAELVEVSDTLAQAGLSIEQTKKILEGLARTRLSATFGDMKSTTEGIIAVMGQFKIPAEEITSSLAAINATAAKYAIESADIIAAVKRTGGAFATASEGIVSGNDALIQFNALITSVRQTTRQAPETIATGLRTIISRLQKVSTIDYFKNIGIDLRDAEGNFIGVYNAIQKIGQAFANVNPLSAEFAKAAEVVGGTRQYGIVIPLLREFALQQDVVNKTLKEQGDFIKQSLIPLDTLVERFNILKNTFANFSRDVYNNPVFQFLGKEAITLSSNLVQVLDNISALVPLLTLVGGAKLAAGVYQQGGIGFFLNRITKHAFGGYIGGTGQGDSQLIMAQPGEFVLRQKAARKLGPEVLHQLNNIDRFAMGGYIGKKTHFAGGGIVGGTGGTNFGDLNTVASAFIKIAKEIGLSSQQISQSLLEVAQVARDIPEAIKLFNGALKSANYKSLEGGGTTAGYLAAPMRNARSTSRKFQLLGPAREPNYLERLTSAKPPRLSRTVVQQRSDGTTERVSIPESDDEYYERIRNTPRLTDRRHYQNVPFKGSLVPAGRRDLIRYAIPLGGKGTLVPTGQNRRFTFPGAPGINAAQNGIDLGNGQELQFPSDRPRLTDRRHYQNVPFKGALTTVGGRDLTRYAQPLGSRTPRRIRGPGQPLLTDQRQIKTVGVTTNVGFNPDTDPLLGKQPKQLGFGRSIDPYYQFRKETFGTTQQSSVTPGGPGGFGGGSNPVGPHSKITPYRRLRAGLGRLSSKGLPGGNAQTLGIGAFAAQSVLPSLGFSEPLTNGISGLLGGAAAGSLLAPGIGTVIGGALGGASAFVNSSHEAEQSKAEKELEKTTNELNAAFSDLSAGGIAKLDELFKKRNELVAKSVEIEQRGIVGRTLSAVGSASLGEALGNPGVISSLLGSTSFLGAGLYGAVGAGTSVAAAPLIGAGAVAGYGIYKGGEAIYNTAAGNAPIFSEDNGGKGGNSSNFITDAIYRNQLDEYRGKQNAEANAGANAAIGPAARARIKELLLKRNQKGITDELLVQSISDKAGLNLGNRRGQISNAQTEILPEIQKEVDAELKARQGFSNFFRAIDNFQTRMEGVSASLAIFGDQLELSNNEIGNAVSVANGDFKTNRAFSNPFTNLEGKSNAEIDKAVAGLEGFFGNKTKADPAIVQTLKSIPVLNNLPNLLNDEFNKILQSPNPEKYGVTDAEKIQGIINYGGSKEFSGLPAGIKKQLSDVFNDLDNEQVADVIGGRNPELLKKFQEIIGPTQQAAQAMQEAQNKFKESIQNAGNQKTGLLVQDSSLAVAQQQVLSQKFQTRRQLRGAEFDTDAAIGAQLLAIDPLTGGTTNPNKIGQNIRGLLDRKSQLEKTDSTSANFLQDTQELAGVNAALASATQGLDILAKSAIGLSAIQERLALLEQRRSSARDATFAALDPNNRRNSFKGNLALSLFDQQGLGGVAAAGLSPEDLQRGIEERTNRLRIAGASEEDINNFVNPRLTQINQQGIGLGLFGQEANERINAINNPEIAKRQQQADEAFNRQLAAIQIQRELLAKGTTDLDTILTNKFVAGVDALKAAFEGFKVPEVITMDVKHTHTIEAAALTAALQGLNPVMKGIAEKAINSALSKLTDGRVPPRSNPTGSSN